MAIRRIAFVGTKNMNGCLNCGCKQMDLRNKDGATKCPKCGTVHIWHFNRDSGTVIITDKKYMYLFKSGLAVRKKRRKKNACADI